MRIFVAGASGAIGRPLITELIRQSEKLPEFPTSPFGMALAEVHRRYL
jgi:hypothetical protein